MQNRQVCPIRLLGWVGSALRLMGTRVCRHILRRTSICWEDRAYDHDDDGVTVYSTWLWGAFFRLLLWPSNWD